jgi:uncharacterized protein (TIGR03067 family)
MKKSLRLVFCGVVLLAGCSSPSESSKPGEASETKMVVQSDKPQTATVRQYRNEQYVGEQKVELSASTNVVTLDKSDEAFFQGAWKGRTLKSEPEHQCTFAVSGKTFEFHDQTDTSVWYKGTFSLRQDTTPRQFISQITVCPFPQYVGKTSMAIYRIENGVLFITGNEPGKSELPTAFDDPDAAQVELRRP